ncbi:zinc-dependent alcohol dehydrogenase [Ideonella livida]|uniref:Alcohol dehydrogenase catalytic domain-containing protein n=1 Tax=Ideonella livida TaxID=2707176 RepID=A0A7C9PJB0_9BURK|nr:alcohol dehydrogenase catalytic domain-containing protein [Ideonella livida]NDY92470.1 alcohol dehydrogenase catalytic domain-containing protein [Ideonella livida]
MLALQKTSPAPGLTLADVAPPGPPGPGQALVQVLATGICGSDLHVDDWTPSYHFIAPRLPVTLGHEFVGRVHGGRLDGQRVVVRPSVVCGTCAACTAGQPDACETRTGLGMTRPGAFAPWVLVPERNCVPVPPGLPDALATLAEPLSIAWQALQVAGPVAGQRVLVMGPGTIGQGVALLARRAGAAQVVVSGFDDGPRLQALRDMGFDALVDVARQPLAEAVHPHTGGAPFDLVVEATGVPATITQALPLLRRRGALVVTGIHATPLPLDLTTLVRREQQLRGSFRPQEAAWPEVLAWLATEAETLAPMVSHVLPLARGLEGFALAHGKQATKVVLCPPAPTAPAEPAHG